MYGIERHVLIAAVTLDAPRGLWRKVEECADCAGRRLACAQLQNLAHQHQHGDDAGRFEIDGRCAAVAAERLGENSRHESRSQAVDIGNAGAHGDQREHVEIARSERLPSAHETASRPTAPPWCRESELNVIRWRRLDPIVGASDVCSDFQDEDWKGEHQADPEPAHHVDQFGIGSSIGTGNLGSRAMPQIGHEPGPICRISGCIGQV